MNEYRHYYLYAKGWYEKTNLIEDLKVIQGYWSGIEPKYITVDHLISVVSGIAWEHINSRHKFWDFINGSLQKNSWMIGLEIGSSQ